MLHGGEIYDKDRIIESDFSVNLNPFPCPGIITNALHGAVSRVELYPDMEQAEFRRSVAKAETTLARGDYAIKSDMVLGGNGASEILMGIVMFIRPGKVLLPVPSFYGYRHVLGMLQACEIVEYPLIPDRDFELGSDFIQAITEDIDAVIIANPNNPTGRNVDGDVLKAIADKCAQTGTALIVDECFFKLSDGKASARRYIGEIPGVFVVDAYTKLFSIPGVRVGFLLAAPEDAEGVKRYLPEWSMSVFAQRAGYACAKVSTNGYVDRSMQLIRKEREYLQRELKALNFRVFKSDSNFLLFYSAQNLYEQLLDGGILIRDCANFAGLGQGYYRIAVKNHEANQRFVETAQLLGV